ncbi:MAG TPA: PepSY-associated TM helix domain-containing protein [Polyangiaceae bacterium]|nr:PepSY-associated TM helix domain-containing protein [Polyangiaceae bacterium]
MKLAPRTYQIVWDAHAWVGVVASLLLHVMFFMGAFALFHAELDRWAEPALARPVAVERTPAWPSEPSLLPAAALRPTPMPKLQPLLQQLDFERPLSGAQRVAFIAEAAGLRAYVSRDGAFTEYHYAPSSGTLEQAESNLGSFLYSMHYLGPLPYGVWIAGLASMALLLALVTGVLIHLKDLLRQWFQFRPERVARTWTSDLHKVLGVFGLPYQLLYAWTGAVLCLGYLVVQPLFVELVSGGNERALAEARGDFGAELEPTGQRLQALPDIDALVATAERRWPSLQPTWVGLEHVGDEASTLTLYGDLPGHAFGAVDLVLRARDGSLLAVHGLEDAGVYRRFEAWFFGLHYAQFGGYGIKLLYALLAFATCAVIISGNLVWLARRDPLRERRGQRVLERVTVGIGAGVVPATACAFSANRLLPHALHSSQSSWEQGVFWGVWAAALALSLVWHAPRRVSSVALGLGGITWLALVPLELASPTGAFADPLERGVLLGLGVLGAASLAAGHYLWHARAARPAPAAPLEASLSSSAGE